MKQLAALVVYLFLSAFALGDGPIDVIGDRPITWDWVGCIPVHSHDKATPRVAGLFDLMRRGEYFETYIDARNHFLKNPNDYDDVWILIESTRKRGSFDQLVSDASGVAQSKPSNASKVLLLRALNLSIMHEYHSHRENGDKVKSLIRDELVALKNDETPAKSDLPALVAYLGADGSDLILGRNFASSYSKAHPESLEASLLLVRSLVKGDIYRTVEPGPQGKTGPLRASRGSRAPQLDSALGELDRAEAKFGKNPFISYYEAAALSMKAAISDPKEVDIASLRAKALACSKEFVKLGQGFPRMVSVAERYIANQKFGYFFPFPDE